MPKQILVANKSRKQTIKVNFRQGLPLPSESRMGVTSQASASLARSSEPSDMDRQVHQFRVHTGSVECMTFPGGHYEVLIALLIVGARTKTGN